MAAIVSLFGIIFLGTAFVLWFQINGWLALGASIGVFLDAAIGL